MKPRTEFERGDEGMTLLEMSIVLVLLVVMVGGFSKSITDAVDFTVAGVGTSDLQEIGRRTLDRIKADIQSTGRFMDPAFGIQMPHVYSNGQPSNLIPSTFAHDQTYLAQLAAKFPTSPPWPQPANPPAFVAPGSEVEPKGIREMVFRFPADLDGDGRIVSSATGAIEWSPWVVGYILVPNADGTLNLIRRRINGTVVQDETICRCVEALTFDTVDTKNILPLRAVEVHLHLMRRTSRGQVETLHLATTAGMRNS
jgi:hypothetical protein